jgi:hypothetical protein
MIGGVGRAKIWGGAGRHSTGWHDVSGMKSASAPHDPMARSVTQHTGQANYITT